MPDEPEVFVFEIDLDGKVRTQKTRPPTVISPSPPASGQPLPNGPSDDEPNEPELRITLQAERRARELGVDPADVDGTGIGGRITVPDVDAYARRRAAESEENEEDGPEHNTEHEVAISDEVEIAESEVSQWLNKKADDIASDIEREVRRAVRPFVAGPVTVQAEVDFKPGGSLIIGGTVLAVVGALGTIGGQAVSQALGQNLAKILDIPITRVLRRWLNRGNQAAVRGQLQLEPLDMHVDPAYVAQSPRQATVSPTSEESSSSGTGWLSWSVAALAVLVLLDTILLVLSLVMLVTMATPT